MSRPVDRYAVCELALRMGSFAADVALVRAADIAAIGVDAAAVDAIGVDEAVRVLAGEGVRVSSYMGLGDILEGEGAVAPIDEVARRLDIAARLGAPAALVATGPLGPLAPEPADATCREWLTRAAPLAVERGVRIMLEPVHPMMRRWSYVHTLGHARELVDGIPGVGVLLDLGHVWWEHGLAAQIRDHVGDIVSVQVTNVDVAALEELRYERSPLDTGDVPVAALIDVLEAAGYCGWYENEMLARIPRDRRLDALCASRAWLAAR